MMIDPQSIDLSELPLVALSERSELPSDSGIYFAIDSLGTVQYIGRAVNIQRRWKRHHRLKDLAAVEEAKITYLLIDLPEMLPDIEAALIKWFNPPLNRGVAFPSRSNPKRRKSFGKAPQVTITLSPTAYEEFSAIAAWQQIPLSTFLRQLLDEAHRSPSTASLMRRVKASQGLDNELTELGLDAEQIAGVKALLKKMASRDS